jgi:hypothetical protein
MTTYLLEFMVLLRVKLSEMLNVPRVPNWSTDSRLEGGE